MKKLSALLLILSSVICLFAVSCTKADEPVEFDVQFKVPETIEINYGAKDMTFRVMFGKAPLKTDVVLLGDPTGNLRTCPIIEVSQQSFKISLFDGMVSGDYNVYIQRGSQKKMMGIMTVTITYKSENENKEIEVKDGNNVYGIVSCGTEGIPGVVVSDGFEVVQTDKDGVYQFKSEKKHKYVFISVPSGYEAMSEGVLPKIHVQLTKGVNEAERVDFPLIEAPGQDNHKMLFFGDMHMAARTSDAKQFANFVADINALVSANPDEQIYAMSLGDMTWELYWVSNKYSFDEYLRDANGIKNLQIFHTIGNHDHDMAFAGDFDTVTKYKKSMAPTYYSFNIGKVHYVVIDDIDCKNTGANTSASRVYDDKVVQEQLDWLKKDLSFVPKSTPLVITMHAPVYNDSNNGSLNNTSAFEQIISGYTTHFWTGHTHKMYNVDKLSSKKIFEHNAGAVCATWWWTGHLTSGMHIAQDGAPGGYSIVDVTGTDFEWCFKGTGRDISHQFRTYDRNQIVMTAEKFVPSNKQSASNNKAFEDAAKDWISPNDGNYVYINVWNYDPKWTIEVKEDGKALTVERVTIKDPLHLISYNAKTPTGGFGTTTTKHMFRVKASSATSTLEVKVVDRFGNIYTESMTRPKKFSLDIYK
jgi:hypothetical protein